MNYELAVKALYPNTKKMKQFKGTRGEWEINGIDVPVHYYSAKMTITAGKYYIAEVINVPSQSLANAQLIASAPDLLEALQELYKQTRNYRAGSSLTPLRKLEKESFDKANKAINKALGE